VRRIFSGRKGAGGQGTDVGALVFLLLCFSPGLFSAPLKLKVPAPKIPFSERAYVCYRAGGPLEIDGRLDEESWRKAPWTEDFVDIEGKLKPKPRFKTKAKMLWDDRYLYFSGELEEPHVWATLTQRDSVIYYDNDFEIFIDPDGDTHNYYELEINALNTVWDLLLIKPYRDGGPAVHSWDIQGLRTAVAVNGTLNDPQDKDKGWTVEIAMPWDVLKECVPGKIPLPKSGDQWRINFSRVEYRVSVEDGKYVKMKDPVSGKPAAEDNWVWAPQGLINIHYPEMWGYLEFSDKTAGSGKDYVEDSLWDQDVKRALRTIYYKERELEVDQGGFSADLKALGLGKARELRVDGWDFPPVVQVTDSLFEAFYSNKKGESWHIDRDGRVWKAEPAKK
jgi:hypothetical protein